MEALPPLPQTTSPNERLWVCVAVWVGLGLPLRLGVAEREEGEVGGAEAEGGAGDADRTGDSDGLPEELPLNAWDGEEDCDVGAVCPEDPLDVALVVALSDDKALES